MYTATEYNCSWRFVISIVIKLDKTLNYCLNVCKIYKFVHPNIGFLDIPVTLGVQIRKDGLVRRAMQQVRPANFDQQNAKKIKFQMTSFIFKQYSRTHILSLVLHIV